VNTGDDSGPPFLRILPLLAGLALIALFVRLGFWQLERAAEKIELQAAFDDPADTVPVSKGLQPEPFLPIRASGHYISRQVLIDNAIVDARLGYYVISPFRVAGLDALLLVNRGWIARSGQQGALPEVPVSDEIVEIAGKAGHLPRVGVRPGEAFAEHTGWPRVAVFPDRDEIAAELGQPLLPFVLLLDADQPAGFLRQWQPPQTGPSRH
jgi:surfeit locus 1 family protein